MIFFLIIKSLKTPFDINNFIEFSSLTLKSGSHHKLKYPPNVKPCNHSCYFYFNHLPCLWNSLASVIDLNHSIPTNLYNLFWSHKFNSDDSCSFHFLCKCILLTYITGF